MANFKGYSGNFGNVGSDIHSDNDHEEHNTGENDNNIELFNLIDDRIQNI